jgi:UPF0176 protein
LKNPARFFITGGMNWNVAAFYRFVPLDNPPALQAELQALCTEQGICGTILLAPEGINGTVAGQGGSLDILIDHLDAQLALRQGELKFSHAAEKPFRRLKIRLKKEIITLKAPEADPSRQVGAYVTAENWNALINDPEVLILDTRNDYETEVGVFKGALDPRINTFTQFKDFADKNLDPAQHKKIAMYCTGGIRCEKASSYLLSRGFRDVYHLKGGILKYLETVPAQESLWQGACFVFDDREALAHGLAETTRT